MRNIKLTVSGYLLISLVMVLSLAFSSSVDALQINLFDGTTLLQIVDGGAGDISPVAGVVKYSGTLGVFDIDITSTGVTKPALGTYEIPRMDLNGITVSSSQAGSLKISLSDTNFGPMLPGFKGFLTEVGGTTNGTITFDSYFDISNTLFGTTTQIASLGPFSGGSFSGGENYVGIPASSPFSITLVANIIHPTGNKTSSFNGELSPTPEPGTILLLGLGLLGLGIISRKKVEIEG